MIAAQPFIAPAILAAPSYACPLQCVKSSLWFSNVHVIVSARSSPEIMKYQDVKNIYDQQGKWNLSYQASASYGSYQASYFLRFFLIKVLWPVFSKALKLQVPYI